MTRRRFRESEVIETLLRQGAVILCYRTKERFTLAHAMKGEIQREHVTTLALGGADMPSNCAYSFKEAHARQTFGTKATAANGDIHKIAKAKRCAEKLKVNKRPPGSEKEPSRWPSRPFPRRRAL